MPNDVVQLLLGLTVLIPLAEGRTLRAMPNDVVQLLLGLTVLIPLAVGIGMFSARLFMWATRVPGNGPRA
jgi:hypothetical protein